MATIYNMDDVTYTEDLKRAEVFRLVGSVFTKITPVTEPAQVTALTVATTQTTTATEVVLDTGHEPVTDGDLLSKRDPIMKGELTAEDAAVKNTDEYRAAMIKAARLSKEIVPTTTHEVARYASRVTKIDEQRPNVKGWLTKNTTDPDIPRVLRLLPQFAQEVHDSLPGVLGAVTGSRNSGCINGTALLQVPFKIQTFGGPRRPKVMFRMVHAGQPHAGIKSRLGKGSNPIFLQIQFQKHLIWNCREPSPFLSATHDIRKAYRIAKHYEERGHHHIELVAFRTFGPGWDHSVQRMWHVQTLIRRFHLRGVDAPYLDNEFLIEHSIPEESIIYRRPWNPNNDRLDPTGEIRQEAAEQRRRLINEAATDVRRRKERATAGLPGADDEAYRRAKRIKIGPKMGPVSGA